MARKTEVQSQVESYQRLRMVLDASLLNTQNYKVWIKDKVDQSWKVVSLHHGVVGIEKGTFESSSITVDQLIIIIYAQGLFNILGGLSNFIIYISLSLSLTHSLSLSLSLTIYIYIYYNDRSTREFVFRLFILLQQKNVLEKNI